MEKINYKNQGSRVKGGKLSSYSGSPPIFRIYAPWVGDEGVVIRRSTPPSPLFSKEGVPKAGAFDKEGKPQGRGVVRRLLLSIMMLFSLAAPAHALDISDYTAYPPFLPRVTSPNILFLLDYSKSMVRPAYGTCYKYGSNATTPSSYANCGSVLSGDRVFNHMTDDYSSTTAYYGYYDNGYGRTDISGCNASGTYTDSCAFKYACSAGSYCSKNSGGSWNGNWLNWLTMTQFDVMKKVVIGGDTDPAPDNQVAASPNLKSKLTSLDDSGTTTLIGGIYKAITFSNYSGRAPRAEWSAGTPQTLPYSWIDTPGSGVTTVFGSPTDAADVNGAVRTATLPFDFTFYGTTYTTGANIYINENGWFSFTSTATSYWTNENMPSGNLPNNFIAPFWDDLQVVISKGSTIKTFTVGSSPNRVFVVSFENIINVADAGKADPLTFQALLFEGTSQIVFQYKEVKAAIAGWGAGRSATIGVENSGGTEAKKYSFNGSTLLSNNLAIFMTPNKMLYMVKPQTNDETIFQLAAPLNVDTGGSRNDYNVNIGVTSMAKPAGGCVNGWYANSTANNKNKCYDHEITGLFQDLADGELGGTLGFRLGVMRVGVSSDDGGAMYQSAGGKEINATATSSFFTANRGDGPTDKTPLGEAMYEATRFFKQDTHYWPSTGTADYSFDDAGDLATCSTGGNEYDPYCFQSAGQKVACCKSFVLLLSSGNYSDDFGLNIYDATSTGETPSAPPVMGSIPGCKSTLNNGDTCTGGSEGLKANGGWLDDVVYRAHVADLRTETGMEATQNLSLYVVNTFGEAGGDGTNFLKRAAKYGGFDDSDGDGVYDTGVNCGGTTGEDDKDCDANGDPDTYFEASGGSDLKSKIIDAITEIMRSSASGTSVSVLSTSAGGEGAIYQAYFYPAKLEGETEERTWPGFIKSFFLDKKQNLRDDSSGGTYTCDSTEGTCTNNASPDQTLVASQDKIAQMCLNTTTNEVKVKLYADSTGDYIADIANDGSCPGVGGSDPVVVGMDDVVSIWEAGKKLALRDKSTRNIYAWVDTDHDGVVDNGDFSSLTGEALDFTTSAANIAALKPYLRASDPDTSLTTDTGTLTPADQPRTADGEAENIISFVRGNRVDTSAGTLTATIGTVSTVLDYRYKYRDRCVSIVSSTGTDESGCEDSNSDKQRVWALGDIINSTPTLVSGPGEQYDLLYGNDSKYKDFRTKYQNRRRMVYVGANDGMLHAFNAGIFNESTTSFDDNPSSGNGWGSSTIGDELWAFIPYDNLPHLQWLACNGTDSDPSQCANSEYTHVFYVDARPKVTDVRIFCRNTTADSAYDSSNYPSSCINGQGDASHPNGWGTIMIMSMRFGGGAIYVDLNGDGDTADAGEQSFKSAYYAFDVTDPEKKPKLLWRFTDPDLGFTTSYPAIVRMGAKNETGKWYMVVGNGPKNRTDTTGSNSGTPPLRDYGGKGTETSGKIFVVNLSDVTTVTTFSGAASEYMGDPLVVDKNFDFESDVIYIGSSINTSSTSTDNVDGKVYRINTNGNDTASTTNWNITTLINAAKPVLTSPSVAVDAERNMWVFFGTGRLRNSGSPSDLTNYEQQTFYGIKDACWEGLTATSCITTTTTRPNDQTNKTYVLTELFNAQTASVTVATTQVENVTGFTAGESAACSDGSCSYSDLLSALKSSKKGWYLNLPGYDGATASERVLSRPAVLGGLVLFTTYTPAASICSIFGDSRLYALNYETGTAYSKAIIGSSSTGVGASASTTGTYVSKAIELGKGMPTAVGIAVGEKVTGFVQKSTGEIIRIEAEPGTSVKSGAASWREKTGGGGTSEIETIYKHIVK